MRASLGNVNVDDGQNTTMSGYLKRRMALTLEPDPLERVAVPVPGESSAEEMERPISPQKGRFLETPSRVRTRGEKEKNVFFP